MVNHVSMSGPGVSVSDDQQQRDNPLLSVDEIPNPEVLVGSDFEGINTIRPSLLFKEEDPEAFCQLVQEQGLDGWGEFCSRETDREDLQDDPDLEEDLPPSPEDIQVSAADVGTFDETYLAESQNFGIKGEFAPAPYPLQVLPRVAYTINYNFVWDDDRERWVPKKKGDLVVDNFEDQDITEYGGDTGFYRAVDESTVSAEARNGTALLECDMGAVDTPRRISSTADLNDYPVPGDKFRCWLRMGGDPNNNQAVGFYFGTQGANGDPNGYRVDLKQSSTPDYRIRKLDNGGTNLATASQSYTADNWYEVKVDWQTDGTITATLYDDQGSQLNEITGSDSTFTDGGVGFHANQSAGGSGITYEYDYYRITEAA